MASESKSDKLRTMRERYALAVAFDSDQRLAALDDLRFAFVPGEQWDAHMKSVRGSRPCYEFNKIRQHSKRITNDLRQNRGSIKVRATRDDTADLAEVMNGLIRSIESQSNADAAYDTAGFFASAGGFGVIRITTEYTDDDSFNQDIRIQEVRNPFGVYFDPSSKRQDKRDGTFAFVPDRVSRDEFKRRWPEASPVDFGSAAVGDQGDWWGATDVRIAEYWERTPVKKTIVLLTDGRVIDGKKYEMVKDELVNPPPGADGQSAEPVTMKSSREAESWEVSMSIVCGDAVLEGPHPWAGKFIPIVPVWGDSVNIEGKELWHGSVRPGKDAQRLYNFDRCSMIEVVAKQPKSPFLYTAAHVKGYEKQWEGMSAANAEALPYNPDPSAPGLKPQREPPPTFPTAMLQLAQIDSDDLKAVLGQYNPTMGMEGNETSGKAILARQREGAVANFDYSDNLARGRAFCGEILIDLIPKIYDTERMVRTLGEDGAEKFVTLNQQVYDDESEQWVKLNDLAQSKFDMVATTGPSFTTQRMETADALLSLAQGNGPDALLAKYGAIKNMDTPGMDEILAGMRKMLVGMQLLEPGEKDAPPAPPPGPSPRDVAYAKAQAALSERYQAEADQTEVETQRLLMQDALEFGAPMTVPDLSPGPPEQMQPHEQPPQGGFFMPDNTGSPPQF